MVRPITIDDATIIEAARAVFLERGMRATTADIAKRARVSTGSIFRRYGTKEELFRRVMLEQRDLDRMLSVAERVGEGDVQDALAEMGFSCSRSSLI
jgi:AcrR family transcriptional regulator